MWCLIGAGVAMTCSPPCITRRWSHIESGEPFGTLVLALAVTLIEVALIVSLMLAAGAEASALARDTVFAAVVIILNGIIGLCLLVGGLNIGNRHSPSMA